jgi:hypothetical protein
MIIMKDLSTKDVVVKEEKESSESENESESSGSDFLSLLAGQLQSYNYFYDL